MVVRKKGLGPHKKLWVKIDRDVSQMLPVCHKSEAKQLGAFL